MVVKGVIRGIIKGAAKVIDFLSPKLQPVFFPLQLSSGIKLIFLSSPSNLMDINQAPSPTKKSSTKTGRYQPFLRGLENNESLSFSENIARELHVRVVNMGWVVTGQDDYSREGGKGDQSGQGGQSCKGAHWSLVRMVTGQDGQGLKSLKSLFVSKF